MPDSPIYAGRTPLHDGDAPVTGAFVVRDGEPCYRIAHYDRMRPFFLSVVSAADHWMFISSNGALTAGRRNPDRALFPYYTDDKIHDAQDQTGSKTLLLVDRGGTTYLWEPFSERYRGVYTLQRNLYKNVYGNRLVFEETNRDLGLTFAYAWSPGDRFGFVKHASLRNDGAEQVSLRLLDGLQNLLPYGVDRAMQTERSTLLDAYKKNELLPETGLGLYVLSSIPVDRPEPSEALMATTVWSANLDPEAYLLSSRQLDRFRRGAPLVQEEDVRAERGAYFVHTRMDLAPGAGRDWRLVADVHQGPDDVTTLSDLLSGDDDLRALVDGDVAAGTARLARIVASADGLQCTGDRPTTARHYANVLFNVMRGGIFDDNDRVDREDLVAFVRHYNRPVARQAEAVLGALPDKAPIRAVLAAAERGGRQLERLCYAYLPLAFSRRHGDPSRPWNTFSIDIRNDDGSRNFHYQGNWRDIFQNWEALGCSFPGFLESMIATFVNASTPDGYNPYRITRDGIDWEVIDPADPWSFIGYWGDHQIIYLLKLLELSRAHHPGRLERLLTRPVFAYANVPYRIAPYRDLLRDPHRTIAFDEALEARIAERTAEIGADGRLVRDGDGDVYLVSLAEKLLVPVLAKLTNFVPEGGIWMNTQRPEWNDANNALVGYGVSMVTLYYLRRFQRFAADLFGALPDEAVTLSEEVADLLAAVSGTFARYESLLDGPLTDADRKAVLDALGGAGGAYRARIYAREGFSGVRREVATADVLALLERSLPFLDHTIRANRRADGLYHAYNLLSVEDDGIALHPLYEMLEGQVAVLSAGVLSGAASVEVLDALRASALYRADQHSYLLYPDRRLPRFTEKNHVPAAAVERSALLQRLVADGDRSLLILDARGDYHFHGSFRNKHSVHDALDRLAERGYADAVAQERHAIADLFETLFDHRSYTGRSGTFFGYEGLGCIYWHMVSKLLLAVKETFFRALDAGEDAAVLDALAERYADIRAGLGTHKTPDVYGAFPMDPYSHTPGNRGARQPGMTGQVKEDILSRWGELGVTVADGCIRFRPRLLNRSEFLAEPAAFDYYDLDGRPQTLALEPGTLAFTYGQVPVTYRRTTEPRITLVRRDGTRETRDGLALDRETSTEIFNRTGTLRAIEVALPRS